MSVQQVLSLRKPDRPHRTHASQEMGRAGKKNNIKDILVRNFFRKYPIGPEVSDMDQIRIEKEAAFEFEKFVTATKEINSKNLTAQEARIAEKLRLKRSASVGSNQQSQTFLSPQTKNGPALLGNVRGQPGAKVANKSPSQFNLPQLNKKNAAQQRRS